MALKHPLCQDGNIENKARGRPIAFLVHKKKKNSFGRHDSYAFFNIFITEPSMKNSLKIS